MSVIEDTIRPHIWEYPDSFCECTVFIDGWEGYVKHLAAVIKEALAPAARVLTDIKEDEAVPMKKKRVKDAREQALDAVVERAHPALVMTLGTAKAPSRKQFRETVAGVMEFVDHPDYADQEYFELSYGVMLRVERGSRNWHTFTVFVPATDGMLWYLEREDS